MIKHKCLKGKSNYKPGHGDAIKSNRSTDYFLDFSIPAEAWFDRTASGPIGTDGKDWNKIGGVTYFSIFRPRSWRKNACSAMIAWRPAEEVNRFEVCAYTNDIRARWETSDFIAIDADERVTALVRVDDGLARYRITVGLESHIFAHALRSFKYSILVGPWFGGNRKSPLTHSVFAVMKTILVVLGLALSLSLPGQVDPFLFTQDSVDYEVVTGQMIIDEKARIDSAKKAHIRRLYIDMVDRSFEDLSQESFSGHVSTLSVSTPKAMPRIRWFATGAMLPNSHDADSYRFIGEMGWGNARLSMVVRAYGIDTPEVRGKSKLETTAGKMVRDYVLEIFKSSEVVIENMGYSKYGQAKCEVWMKDTGLHLNQHLVDLGYAKPYSGGAKEKFTRSELSRIIESLSATKINVLHNPSGRWINLTPKQ